MIKIIKRVPMTLRGFKKLREELEYLKNVIRPEIIKNISDARAYGDLKENAEYHAAREQQGFCESRIQEIETKLANSHVIDVTKIIFNNKVVFGMTVCIENLNTKCRKNYRIVGDDEANLKEDLISINSPIARSLIGKEEKEIVIVNTPKGQSKYKIIKIKCIE